MTSPITIITIPIVETQWCVFGKSEPKELVTVLRYMLPCNKVDLPTKLILMKIPRGSVLSEFTTSVKTITANLKFFVSVSPAAASFENYLNEEPEGFDICWISEEKGFGLIATIVFKKGDLLSFCRGERITKQVYEERLAVSFEKILFI